MAPPAKRRKPNRVPDSDDEDEAAAAPDKPQANNTLAKFLFSSPNAKSGPNSSPAVSPTRPSTQPRPAASPSATSTAPRSSRLLPSHTRTGKGGRAAAAADAKSPSTSPEKPKGKSPRKPKVEEKGKSGDLLALFSKQAEKAQATKSNGAATAAAASSFDDLLSDPISDDDDVGAHRASAASAVGQKARKRLRDGGSSSWAVGGNGSVPVPAVPVPVTTSSSAPSQMFLKPPRPVRPGSIDDDLRPWSERFAPVNLDELAVHKKKVADVRRWLDDVMAGRMRQRLLLLKGAAGTGKTTTLRLLARDMGCELLEWRNPAGSLGAAYGQQSASVQFDDFLGRGGRFGQLDVDFTAAEVTAQANGSSLAADGRRKIIMIEEFPNTFSRSSSSLTSFRGAILRFLAANTPSLASFGRPTQNDSIIPMVMIISETLLTTTSALADSFTAHRLLGPEIIRHPGTGLIEFNAIAPSLLAKALELVVQKEARKSGRRRTPGPQVLKRIGEIGDIRSAISALEFLCLKGDQDSDWGAKVTFTKPKKSARDSIALTKGEQESLELISQREASLGIFHAVGKVVYNKREEMPPPDDTVENLAPYMAHLARPKRSLVSVDTLIDETGTDTHTFISALHENYLLSCEPTGPSDPSSAMDYVDGCLEYLSESDLLCPSWDIFFGGRGFSGGFAAGRDSGSHVLRQDEMAFQVAVRGMLFSLPCPVKRKASGPPGKGADAYKMFYPTGIKLWRAKEEIEGLVDVWSTRLLRGEDNVPGRDLTDGAGAFRKAGQGNGVSSWGGAGQKTTKTAAASPTKHAAEQPSPQPTPLLSLGSAARREMILERLPYTALIARANRKGTFTGGGAAMLRTRDVEKVVSFQGIGPPADEDSADEREDNGGLSGEAWATDRPSDEASPRKWNGIRSAARAAGARGQSGLPVAQVQRLVLSDDDIEDD